MQVRRRLTIYPGQVSMVLNIVHAEEFLWAFSDCVDNLPLKHRSMAKNFLNKLKSAIETGKRLNCKQSATDKGNI
jgi:hypothetical protein